ncbi:MAG: alpha/beta hydrolase [Chloroflexi bacterium]|nr:alpha/beta hydrolase [Chloroflexota bacterium]
MKVSKNATLACYAMVVSGLAIASCGSPVEPSTAVESHATQAPPAASAVNPTLNPTAITVQTPSTRPVSDLPTPVTQRDGVLVYRDMPYVANGHPRQKLDVYVPEGQDLGLIVYFHGGGWRGGSKADDASQIVNLFARGHAVASVGYRLSQDAVFPAQVEDAKAAVRWLRAHAAELGVDSDRFVAMGISSGGAMAALLGTTGDVDEFDVGEYLATSSRVQSVVAIAGYYDLLQPDILEMYGTGYLEPLVGGPLPEHSERLSAVSPITYVTEDDPPFLMVHGELDEVHPLHQAEILEASLAGAGIPATLYVLPGGSQVLTILFDQSVRETVLGFLAR